MKIVLTALILFVIFIISCKPQDRTHRRERLMNDLVTALKNNDTNTIFNLIDTNFYLKVRSKEQLIYDSKFAFDQFKECNSSISNKNLSIKETAIHTTEYTLTFCRDSKNVVILNSSFDLILTFADYNYDTKIQFLDFKIYREIKY